MIRTVGGLFQQPRSWPLTRGGTQEKNHTSGQSLQEVSGHADSHEKKKYKYEESVVRKEVLCKPPVPVTQMGSREARSTVSPGSGPPYLTPVDQPASDDTRLNFLLLQEQTKLETEPAEVEASGVASTPLDDSRMSFSLLQEQAEEQTIPDLEQAEVEASGVHRTPLDDSLLNFLLLQEETEEQTIPDTELAAAEVEASVHHSTVLQNPTATPPSRTK
uniref:Uncharacterized protein n=1 Tax=Branchiostoma floridae TaxID=7739 RepID=C3YSW2_BRAFL|eukprot:XP_002600614.1 hypothetical protein BRAFLDRAFT_95128 [Branchiostoma floridae]